MNAERFERLRTLVHETELLVKIRSCSLTPPFLLVAVPGPELYAEDADALI